jgi:site-specific DNA-methyltransferase (adenine-specific)
MTLELNRIYCGDCLDLMREMPDKSVDLVLTDPPYGIGEDGGHNTRIPADRSEREHFRRLNNPKYTYAGWDNQPPPIEYFSELFRISKNQIIFGANHFISKIPYDSPCWIVWDKCNGKSDFADCELAWTSFKSAVRIFSYHKFTGLRGGQDCVHPTQKPLPLMMWCLEKYSKEGMTVLVPFLGSGTTAVACKKLGRDFIGIEKEPAYVAIAEKRLEKVNNHKITDFFGAQV